MVMLADGLLPGHRMCPSTTVACSVMEEKIDLLNDSVSTGLQNREDSAQQIKRCCWARMMICYWIALLVSCVGHMQFD